MAVWSSLKNVGKLNNFRSCLFQIGSLKNVPKIKGPSYVPIRICHERRMPIRSSPFYFKQVKNFINFYLLLGGLPLIAIITYCNLFIGPAQLALIPEGYEPKPWEYYSHPITRFFAKYVTVSFQEQHERNLHNIFRKQEYKELTLLRNKVMEKMRERLDYQSWFFEKPLVKYERKFREETERLDDEISVRGGFVLK